MTPLCSTTLLTPVLYQDGTSIAFSSASDSDAVDIGTNESPCAVQHRLLVCYCTALHCGGINKLQRPQESQLQAGTRKCNMGAGSNAAPAPLQRKPSGQWGVMRTPHHSGQLCAAVVLIEHRISHTPFPTQKQDLLTPSPYNGCPLLTRQAIRHGQIGP